MEATRPTDALEQEHRIIQRVVGAMAALADEVEKGKVIPPEVVQDLLEFLRTFADRCHHGKEEACLFPMLERKGFLQEVARWVPSRWSMTAAGHWWLSWQSFGCLHQW